ncbi:MAG TPA: histidine kinase [Holophagaceae bacterium]|nr:histidine kinase [Holophagaceae bacterium]
MTLDLGPGRAFASLAARLRRPLYWAAFLGVYLPSVSRDVVPQLRAGAPVAGFPWLPTLLTPALYLLGMMWLSPMPWQLRVVRQRKGLALLTAMLFSEAYMAGLVLLDGFMRHRQGMAVAVMPVLLDYLTFHGPIMALVGAVQALWERVQSENAEIREQAKRDQARVLQGQLHPHVLFNALNGLAELVHKSPPQAEASIRHLSDLLRQVMRAVDQPDYALGQERSLLEDYLNMERLRLGTRLRLRWEWEEGLETQPVPPLLLQGLLENALKHGVAPSLTGGEVVLQARADQGELRLAVRNTGVPLGEGDPSRNGLGLANLRDRLDLIYGGAGSFSLHSEGEWTHAEIRLPLALGKEPR